MEDLTNPTSTEEMSATSENTTPDSNGSETVQTGGEAIGEQSAPVTEDNFTRVDPKTLPPQLRAAYDNMLRDYKEKTTKLSETIKAEVAKNLNPYREKADFYDRLTKEEAFVAKWNEYVQQVSQPTAQNPNTDPAVLEVKTQLQQIQQKLQEAETHEIMSGFADAVNEKGVKLHPDFDMLNSLSIGQRINGTGEPDDFSLLRACVELSGGNSPQEKLANGYKAAKSLYTSIFEQGKKAGMNRLQTKVQNSSLPPSNSNGETLQLIDKKPTSAREALEMARKGQIVSRD